MIELKPCPFCGSTNVVIVDGDKHNPYPAILCERCLVAVSNPPDKETLIDMWNLRLGKNGQVKMKIRLNR